jgi:hypothetical protein
MTNYTTILTSVKDALNTAVDTIKSAQKALYEQANTEKYNLIKLLQEMAETKAAIGTLGTICGDAGDALLTLSDGQLEVVDKISNVIDFNDIPCAAYQEFVEFCDECGDEILVGEEYDTDGKGYFKCANCIAMEEEDTKAESDEAEQLAFDIPETVVAENA